MRSIRLCRSVALLAGFLWVSTMAHSGSGQSQTSTKPDAASPSSSQSSAVPKKPTKRPVKSAAWHDFGEGDSASVTGPSQSGVWYRFGKDSTTQQVGPRVSTPTQNLNSGPTSDLERQMWALVNQDRLDPANAAETRGGHAQPLRWNQRLAEVARAHSRDMMEQGFFDHVDPQGRTPAARIKAAGIPWRALGENIATNGGGAEAAEAAFMNEPRFQKNHRSNILNTKYSDVGIGIVQDRRGRYYITQDFVAVPPSRLK